MNKLLSIDTSSVRMRARVYVCPSTYTCLFAFASVHAVLRQIFKNTFQLSQWLLLYTEIAPKFGESSMDLIRCTLKFRFNLLDLFNYSPNVAELSLEYQIWNLITKVFVMEFKINYTELRNRKLLTLNCEKVNADEIFKNRKK